MTKRILTLALIAGAVLSTSTGCGSRMGGTATPTPLATYEAQPLPTERGELFAASGACTSCHSNLGDEAGNDVSMDTDWRAAMMANAARDPYWQASVRLQVADYPHLADTIEEKCATCHTPMAHFTATSGGGKSPLLDQGFLQEDHPRHTLAIDGVSCTLCHQVEEESLGAEESFSGGFSVDTERPTGERLIYGPFPPVEEPAAVMRDASGYEPVEGPHLSGSELCATCHTLYTPYVDEEGEIAGTFAEQVPYLEWLHSDHHEESGCQDCHMPHAEGEVALASIGGGPPRSPFGRHLFIGGNTYVLKLLWAFGEEIGVTASSEHFERKIDQTLDQLQNRAATVSVEEAGISDDELNLAVAVENQAGHKVPTAFPSRRAWLHVTVRDAEGALVFESGAANADGSIVGNDNDADAAAYEPHYTEISSPDQVQIYEAILEDVGGNVTTGLLAAKGYRKDNRLLPSGFDKTTAGEDFGVHGPALDDADFSGGGDIVRYALPLDGAAQPLSVSVRLLYQAIGHRWAENVRPYDTPETNRFLRYYDAVPNEPVEMAAVEVTVGQ